MHTLNIEVMMNSQFEVSQLLHPKLFIERAMVAEITSNLTMGRTDENQEPLSTFQIKEFLKSHNTQIADAVNEMYNAHRADGELNKLHNLSKDAFREYLRPHVDVPY